MCFLERIYRHSKSKVERQQYGENSYKMLLNERVTYLPCVAMNGHFQAEKAGGTISKNHTYCHSLLCAWLYR